MKCILFLYFITFTTYISCKTKWKYRSIYKLLLTDRFSSGSGSSTCKLGSYCRGDYQGMIKKLDYIKGMGFDAIRISPIIENTEGSYHGYHFTNLYKLNSHFGTESVFKDFADTCHRKDIWVMIDIVANHAGSVGTDYSKINPFNSAEHYHVKCDKND